MLCYVMYVCMYVCTAWYWQEMWRHHLSLGIRGWKGPHWSPCGSRFQNPNPQSPDGHSKPSNFCCYLTKIRMSEGLSLLRNHRWRATPLLPMPNVSRPAINMPWPKRCLAITSRCRGTVPTTRSRGLRCRKFVSKSAFSSLVIRLS